MPVTTLRLIGNRIADALWDDLQTKRIEAIGIMQIRAAIDRDRDRPASPEDYDWLTEYVTRRIVFKAM